MQRSGFKIELLSDVGTAEAFVSRVALGFSDLLDGAILDESAKKKAKDQLLSLTIECLIPAFVSLRQLRDPASSEWPVVNRTKLFDEVYRNSWTAYKDRLYAPEQTPQVTSGFRAADER